MNNEKASAAPCDALANTHSHNRSDASALNVPEKRLRRNQVQLEIKDMDDRNDKGRYSLCH